jgi:glycosyltransferase involved in cell wall biosynthesis
MLKGENIIIFSCGDWQTPRPTSPTHLSINFAKENKVLFVETFGSRWPSFNPEHIQRLGSRIANWIKGIDEKGKGVANLHIYSPISLILNFRPFLAVNRLIFLSIVQRLINKLSMEDPIMIFYIPPPLGAVKMLKAKSIVYHCIDEWSTYPGGKNKIFMDSEKELIENADLVIAASQLLYEKKKTNAKRIMKMYHGVDYKHFSGEFSENAFLPEDIINIPKPVIAIVGSFVDWMDLDLIKSIALRHPEWSVISIGAVDFNVDIGDLKNVKNIYFLKEKDYSQLPSYYKAIDVFIVPFLLTEHIKYCAPTRLYEHLSSGRPIVTTDFPAVHEVGEGLISIAYDKQDFVKKVEAALAERDLSLIEKRKSIARANTWESRVEQMSRFIKEASHNDI